MSDTFARAPYGVIEITPGGTIKRINDRARELLALESTPLEEDITDHFPESVDASVHQVFEGESPSSPGEQLSFEEYYPTLDRWMAGSVVHTDEQSIVYFDDVTSRHDLERQLDERGADLNRLAVINDLISDILGELVGATSREEIAETICTRLGDTDRYEFAWVGERDIGSDEIVMRASAGTSGRTLAAISDAIDGNYELPERKAIATGESVLISSVGGATMVPETIRRAAFADGLQSVLAIPLTQGSNVYGVVGLYTAGEDAFSDRERASFETMGEMAGFAINAARHRTLLRSDTVVELTIDITDPEMPLTGVAMEQERPITVDGFVVDAESVIAYLSVDDDPETVAQALADHDAIHSVRSISTSTAGASVEVIIDEESPLGRVATLGATVQTARFGSDGGRLIVECSPAEDIRRMADSIVRDIDASVVAKRETERDMTTAKEFRDKLRDRLTERQETALRTAFFANYFESPRGSSAEEVASTLDITGPTLLHHLRAGQRKLLAEYFQPTE